MPKEENITELEPGHAIASQWLGYGVWVVAVTNVGEVPFDLRTRMRAGHVAAWFNELALRKPESIPFENVGHLKIHATDSGFCIEVANIGVVGPSFKEDVCTMICDWYSEFLKQKQTNKSAYEAEKEDACL